jgi:hypothetical protein
MCVCVQGGATEADPTKGRGFHGALEDIRCVCVFVEDCNAANVHTLKEPPIDFSPTPFALCPVRLPRNKAGVVQLRGLLRPRLADGRVGEQHRRGPR